MMFLSWGNAAPPKPAIQPLTIALSAVSGGVVVALSGPVTGSFFYHTITVGPFTMKVGP